MFLSRLTSITFQPTWSLTWRSKWTHMYRVENGLTLICKWNGKRDVQLVKWKLFKQLWCLLSSLISVSEDKTNFSFKRILASVKFHSLRESKWEQNPWTAFHLLSWISIVWIDQILFLFSLNLYNSTGSNYFTSLLNSAPWSY